MERVVPSDVLSGRGGKAQVPTTVWLANFRCRFATEDGKTRSILGFYLHYKTEEKLTVRFSGETKDLRKSDVSPVYKVDLLNCETVSFFNYPIFTAKCCSKGAKENRPHRATQPPVNDLKMSFLSILSEWRAPARMGYDSAPIRSRIR
jgi:hypothetical protein